MGSNLTLTPAEEPLWWDIYRDTLRNNAAVVAATLGGNRDWNNVTLIDPEQAADAAILALRERREATGEVPFPVGARVCVWGADATVVGTPHPGRYTVLCGDGVRYDVDAALVGAPVATGEATP